MKVKPITPYQRLHEKFELFVFNVKYPRKVLVWRYDQKLINSHSVWAMSELQQRVIAANHLGYDVMLESNEYGLDVFYRKRPNLPMI